MPRASGRRPRWPQPSANEPRTRLTVGTCSPVGHSLFVVPQHFFRRPSTKRCRLTAGGRPYGMRRGLPWPTSRAGEPSARTHARHMFAHGRPLSRSPSTRRNVDADRRGGAGEFTTEAPEAPVECERADDQDALDGGPDGPRRPRAEAARAPAERERAEDPTHGRHALARPSLSVRSPSTLFPSSLNKTVPSHRRGRPYSMRRGLPWPTSRAGESPIRTHARHMFNRPPTLLT